MADRSPAWAALMSLEDLKFAAERLQTVSVDVLEQYRSVTPNLPEDYLEWMNWVGWGDLVGRFMVYSGPVPVREIYGANAPVGDAVAVGDDMAGYVIGLDLASGGAVEWDAQGEEVARWPSFKAFAFERLAQLREDLAVTS